jgi:methionine salvage enolase-phosphatase E1
VQALGLHRLSFFHVLYGLQGSVWRAIEQGFARNQIAAATFARAFDRVRMVSKGRLAGNDAV